MNWDDLKIFLDVARQPKLDKAALHLSIDATTISRRLRRLESDLGQTLFERTRRGHILTQAGEQLLRRVEEMESLSLDIASDGSSQKDAAGRIRLGATEGLGTTIIAPSLAAFRTLYPDIHVDLIALSGFVSVPKREADMSILLTRPAKGRLKIRKLADYTLQLYAADQYLAARGRISSTSDLSDETLIGYVDDLIYSSQLRYFDELMPGIVPQLCSPSILAQAEMITAGAGIGFLPEFMALRLPNLREVMPDQMRVKRSFWLSIHEDVAGLARNRVMIDFLSRTLSRLS